MVKTVQLHLYEQLRKTTAQAKMQVTLDGKSDEPEIQNLHNVRKINIKLDKSADRLSNLIQQLKEPNKNYQINEIHYLLDVWTKVEHIQELFSAIEQYNKNKNINNIEKVAFEVETKKGGFGSLTKLAGLRCPVKYFSLDIPNSDEWVVIFTELTTVLRSGTNFNQFDFATWMLFVDDIPEKGFKEFCEYFIEHNDALVSFNTHYVTITTEAMSHLIRVIRSSTSLTELDLTLPSTNGQYYDIFNALNDSTVKMLRLYMYGSAEQKEPHLASGIGRLIGSSQKLEEIELNIPYYDITTYLDVKNGLKATKTLRKFSLSMASTISPTDKSLRPPISVSVFEENESITDFNVSMGEAGKVVVDVGLRNKKLQNERVRSTIVLLYNIARLNHCNSNSSSPSSNSIVSIVPSDVWTLIMSHIKHPGVKLDFGLIARKIFNDPSIRRVI